MAKQPIQVRAVDGCEGKVPQIGIEVSGESTRVPIDRDKQWTRGDIAHQFHR